MRRDHPLIEEAARSLLVALGVDPWDSGNEARLELVKGVLAEFYGVGFTDATMLVGAVAAEDLSWARKIVKSTASEPAQD